MRDGDLKIFSTINTGRSRSQEGFHNWQPLSVVVGRQAEWALFAGRSTARGHKGGSLHEKEIVEGLQQRGSTGGNAPLHPARPEIAKQRTKCPKIVAVGLQGWGKCEACGQRNRKIVGKGA